MYLSGHKDWEDIRNTRGSMVGENETCFHTDEQAMPWLRNHSRLDREVHLGEDCCLSRAEAWAHMGIWEMMDGTLPQAMAFGYGC